MRKTLLFLFYQKEIVICVTRLSIATLLPDIGSSPLEENNSREWQCHFLPVLDSRFFLLRLVCKTYQRAIKLLSVLYLANCEVICLRSLVILTLPRNNNRNQLNTPTKHIGMCKVSAVSTLLSFIHNFA